MISLFVYTLDHFSVCGVRSGRMSRWEYVFLVILTIAPVDKGGLGNGDCARSKTWTLNIGGKMVLMVMSDSF
jgi:hypothetical protein